MRQWDDMNLRVVCAKLNNKRSIFRAALQSVSPEKFNDFLIVRLFARSWCENNLEEPATCTLSPWWNSQRATWVWKPDVLRAWEKKRIPRILLKIGSHLRPSILQANSLASTMGATTLTGLPIDLSFHNAEVDQVIQLHLQNSIPLILVGIFADCLEFRPLLFTCQPPSCIYSILQAFKNVLLFIQAKSLSNKYTKSRSRCWRLMQSKTKPDLVCH